MDAQQPSPKKGKLETLLIIAAVILALLVILGIFVTVRLLRDKPEEAISSPAPQTQALTMPEDLLPGALTLGQLPPDFPLTDENGQEVHLSDLARASEHGLWLVFWASWCPDCTEQFEILSEMERLAADSGVELILIDRLNPERETRETAREKLAAFQATARCLYDENEACYRGWAMHEIPGHVLLNPNGTVGGYRSGTLTAGECEGMLWRFRNGRAAAGFAYISSRFLNEAGGVMTSTEQLKTSPSGADVLSESQGLMLRYALETGDQALFDSVLAFTEEHLMTQGLAVWYVSAKGKKADVNALLDDLRIWDALRRAGEVWGAPYDQKAEEMSQAILKSCVNGQGELVDYVELRSGKKARTISLCYLDPEILEHLAAADERYRSTVDKAVALVTGGRISDSFPLYYSSYDYGAGKYSQNDLNTSEALYVLWNLSKVGALPEDTLSWLREKVMTSALAARYRVDGEVVNGYDYHSTAVYGLAALIAREAGDQALFETAVRRMERQLELDYQDKSYGGYRQKGAAVYAFDQLIPLLVSVYVDRGWISE